MIDKLLLLSGNDIPFPGGRVFIHQPTLKEIGLITEPVFLYGSRCLIFSKENLPEKDKIGLEDKSDFDIFMSMMNNKEVRKFHQNVEMVLKLLFPSYEIQIKEDCIHLKQEEHTCSEINSLNYQELKDIVENIFLFSETKQESGYNPQKGRAEKIAEKLKRGKERTAKSKGIQIENLSIYDNYISVLSIGMNIDINVILNYTVYQLLDQYKRYGKKYQNDIQLKAKLAGATGMEETENWME